MRTLAFDTTHDLESGVKFRQWNCWWQSDLFIEKAFLLTFCFSFSFAFLFGFFRFAVGSMRWDNWQKDPAFWLGVVTEIPHGWRLAYEEGPVSLRDNVEAPWIGRVWPKFEDMFLATYSVAVNVSLHGWVAMILRSKSLIFKICSQIRILWHDLTSVCQGDVGSCEAQCGCLEPQKIGGKVETWKLFGRISEPNGPRASCDDVGVALPESGLGVWHC